MDELPNPITRSEQYLAKIAGAEPTLPTPITREERYLAKIAGEDVDIPPAPITRTEQYLAAIVEGGGGVEVESLSVTANGTYTASEGKAYSPVSVAVENSYAAGDEGKVVSNGALVAQTSDSVTENGTVDTTLISSLEVNVPQGGGGEAPEKDVNFIDYDGTILYSYTADEFAALTELPANPTHEGLTAQGWNWTLADAKTHVAEVGELYIGQMYVTASGATEIDIIVDGARDPYLNIAGTGETSIDWGDGTTPDVYTLSGISSYTRKTHHYSKDGHYTIKIDCANDKIYSLSGGGGTSSLYGCLSGNNINSININKRYGSSVSAVRLGARHRNLLGQGEFHTFYSMKYITIPSHITADTSSGAVFRYCTALTALVLPANFHIKYTYFCEHCHGLRRVSLPNMADFFGASYSFDNCFALKKITIPNMATSVGGYLTSNNYSITRIIVPKNVTSISSMALSSDVLAEIVFQPATPPAATNAFSGLSSTCFLYIPYASLAAYLTASNYPAPATYTYIGFATYNSGVTLPTQDSTEAYNVVWYASKDDAIAQTNPITQGNGKEVYCRYTAV